MQCSAQKFNQNSIFPVSEFDSEKKGFLGFDMNKNAFGSARRGICHQDMEETLEH
jgi:hypothetical protein